MVKIMVLMAGGAVGTLARYGLSGFVQRYSDSAFPYGTMAVNLIGSLLIGLLWGMSENLPASWRTFIFIGVLGGFTTFSTFSLETLNLLRDGETRLAFANLLISNLLGISLAFCGFIGGKALLNFTRW